MYAAHWMHSTRCDRYVRVERETRVIDFLVEPLVSVHFKWHGVWPQHIPSLIPHRGLCECTCNGCVPCVHAHVQMCVESTIRVCVYMYRVTRHRVADTMYIMMSKYCDIYLLAVRSVSLKREARSDCVSWEYVWTPRRLWVPECLSRVAHSHL